MNALNGGTETHRNDATIEPRPEREFDRSAIDDTSDEDAARQPKKLTV